jgi:spore coat polysaccharide biosynthesis protein SpsF
VLAWCIKRLRRAKSLDGGVVVATSTLIGDDAVVALCQRLGCEVIRGSETDVLGRYAQAAKATGWEHVVRVTADCPFVDPQLVDELVGAYLQSHTDYASNTGTVGNGTYPDGLDLEVFSAAQLQRIHKLASLPYDREHVTPYFYTHPAQFKLFGGISAYGDRSRHRWTIDTPRDLTFARALAAQFEGHDFPWTDALRVVEREAWLLEMSVHGAPRGGCGGFGA